MERNRAPIGAKLMDGSYDETQDGIPLATCAANPASLNGWPPSRPKFGTKLLAS